MVGRLLRVTGTALVIAVALVTPVFASATVTPASADTVIDGCTIVSNPTPTNFTNCPSTSGTSLLGANLSGVDLSFANLAGDQFANCLAATGCQATDFTGANLTDANLTNAIMETCAPLGFGFNECPGANLTGAKLTGANLTDATFASCALDQQFDGVCAGANLSTADLSDANLSGAVLGTGITDPFGNPVFGGANLANATLTGATFTGASLSFADFTGTILVPSNQTVAATSAAGAVVSWPTPPSLPGATPGTCSPHSGSTFPIGQSMVSCGVSDDRGSSGIGSFTVTVAAPPTTSVLVPSNGASVSSGIVLDAGASSPAGIASVTFEVSGGSISDKVVSSSGPTFYGYIGEWDTTDVPNGTYTLQSVATDTLGQTSTSAPITVTVNNPSPTTSVLIPSDGATQTGAAALLDAGSSAKVTNVNFELSGGTLSDKVISAGFATIYGWLGRWNTTSVPNGTYALQSVASYSGGVSGTSAPITITVNNPPPTTAVLIPSNGASQSGTAALLDASASPHVTAVTYELTGGTLTNQVIATGTPTLYGWLAHWDTTTVPNGTYTLQSVASYAGGVSGTSAPITINVSN